MVDSIGGVVGIAGLVKDVYGFIEGVVMAVVTIMFLLTALVIFSLIGQSSTKKEK